MKNYLYSSEAAADLKIRTTNKRIARWTPLVLCVAVILAAAFMIWYFQYNKIYSQYSRKVAVYEQCTDVYSSSNTLCQLVALK